MRQAVVIAVIGLAIIAGGTGYFLMRPMADPPKAAVSTEPAPPLPPSVLKGRSGVDAVSRGAKPNVNTAPVDTGKPGDSASASNTTLAASASSPNLATLRFDSDVPGAKLFFDREPVGEMPITVSNVKPGPHRVNVSVPGYDFVVETIEVTPGPRDIVFKFKEVRLDARIDVVHHHRIGSCSGTVIATAREMRYTTSDKNDAFTVPLLEVEGLQIDYLENRLRLTVRGKRYDFSDPKGNADPLFVFHRDVEKARERLKNGDLPASE